VCGRDVEHSSDRKRNIHIEMKLELVWYLGICQLFIELFIFVLADVSFVPVPESLKVV
jgi:hypothetical protein